MRVEHTAKRDEETTKKICEMIIVHMKDLKEAVRL
jgi:hypothetical protein